MFMSESTPIYRTLLAPVDGSHRAELILSHVQAMAERYDSAIVLLRVVDPNQLIADTSASADELTPAALAQLVTDAEAYLQSQAETLRAQGATVRTRVAVGPVVRTIVRIVEEENVDLVALASHGRTGLSRAFFGSVASGLLNQCDRPLLLIRATFASET